MNINSPSRQTSPRAFTLIEMLVVIAIIGILAGLIVGGAGFAMSKSRRSRAETERDALVTMIESYKKAKGYYPPDNPGSTIYNGLFYELTGTIHTNIGGNEVYVGIHQEQFSTNTILALFGTGGFNNSSGDPTEVRNFFGAGLTRDRYATFQGPFSLLGIRVSGSPELRTNLIDAAFITPWNYVSSNPTNNPNDFDLWIDVKWGGKTNRVSNWSKDPQPLP